MTPPTPGPAASPSVAVVEAICGHPDPILRNLAITQAYHDLSAALRASTGPAASWCTFATWASKQAGQTIRREDLVRKIEADFAGAEVLTLAARRIHELARSVGRAADQSVIVAALREVFAPARPITRASEAVARGNLKVFEEIGREFARFIPLLRGGAGPDAGALEGFGRALRPGPPPGGQDLLRTAFGDYARTLSAADPKTRAEWMLLANLRIGLHEQTRLQPEIAEALDAPIPDPRALRERLLQRLFPGAGWLLGLRIGIARSLGWTSPLEEACGRLAGWLRQRVRALLTEEFMTLALPAGPLRLGTDVPGAFPEALRSLANPALLDLLRTVDPTPDSPRESGAADWANLGERMHFIADLFRARQEDRSLFGAPFTPEQTLTIREGAVPGGRL